PTPFGPDEIEATGSPLFTEAFKAGGILEFRQPFEGNGSFLAVGKKGKILSRLYNIPGKLTGGHKEGKVDWELPGCPLNLTVTAKREGGAGPIRFGFDMRRWHGSPILLLPYFDQIAAFFEGVKDAVGIDLRCFLLGNEFFSGRIHEEDLGIFKGLAGLL